MSAAVAKGESDTNLQHAGIDEGGLVKKSGDILVVLRRGRLFTIDTAGSHLVALDTADLAPKESTHSAHKVDWYDELLIADRTVIVIGYSNSHQGTEIVLFDLRERGRLEYKATYNLRSDDYYSSDNYASRLVGGKLILYTTRALPDAAENLEWLPAMRRWTSGSAAPAFERIATFDRVFTKTGRLGAYPTVHTMVTCDPAAIEFTCEGTVILGDYLTMYYASPTAGYAWTHHWSGDREDQPRSTVFRIPFDGSPISALQVRGEPSNQFAFLETADEHLNVVVRQDAEDGNSWIALLQTRLDQFGDGSSAAPTDAYRQLARGADWMTVRFIGESALVAPFYSSRERRLIVAMLRSPQIDTITLDHDIERIEALGSDAIVIGSEGNRLGMTTIDLAARPSAVTSLRFERAQQAESRSHGFLYRAESPREGVFGLPVLISTESTESASVVFIRNHGLALHPSGSLDTTEEEEPDDNCIASCADWYGNARALFSGERVFALMGYELIEGRIESSGRISETGRLNFNPALRASKH